MPGASGTTRGLAVRVPRELSDSSQRRRSARSRVSGQWRPPEGFAPDDVLVVVDAALGEHNRLVLKRALDDWCSVIEAASEQAM